MRFFLAGLLSGAVLVLVTEAITHRHPHAAPLSTAATTARDPQFDTPAVKVWRTTVVPNSPTALHRHDHPRVIVALTDGTMRLVDQSGAAEDHAWKAGHAYYLPAMPPNALHQDVNPGTQPLEVMAIELEREP